MEAQENFGYVHMKKIFKASVKENNILEYVCVGGRHRVTARKLKG